MTATHRDKLRHLVEALSQMPIDDDMFGLLLLVVPLGPSEVSV